MRLNAAMIKKAVATPGLKLVMGSDAVAGAHGRNADELVERVRQAANGRWTRSCRRRRWQPNR